MAQLNTFPGFNQPVVDASGALTPLWRNYFTALDAVLRGGKLGPLVQAANDAAAAAAGVPIGGLYASGNAVQVRIA